MTRYGTIRPEHHGTSGGYNNYACRCELCREAQRLHHRRWREANKGRPLRHGEYSSYTNYACRCQPCRDAYTTRKREYRERRAAS
jgi:hypothetical protein